MSEERWLRRRRRTKRSYSTFKVRRAGGEEIPLIQGKDQILTHFLRPIKYYFLYKSVSWS